MPTRRAFLVAGATFSFGVAIGGACGYSVGAARAAAAAPAGEPELEPSGDLELDELRRLAVKAPIEELIERRLVFLNSLSKDYPRDRTLWQGARRLAEAILGGSQFSQRRLFARFLAQVIEQGEPTLVAELLPLATRLRKVE